MRKLIFVLLFLCPILCKAQLFEKHFIYAKFGVFGGNYAGLNAGINYSPKGKYHFGLSAVGTISSSRLRPNDYNGGLAGFLSFGLNSPTDKTEAYHITLGRIIQLNKKGTIRLNLQAGIGTVRTRFATNFAPTGNGSLGANYTFSKESERAIGYIINPKIEFPLAAMYGLALSPVIMINERETYFGLGIENLFGFVRRRTSSIESSQ